METDKPAWAEAARLILYHKQGASARTLFLRHASGSIITPCPLPFLSTLLEEEGETGLAVFMHPAALVRSYCEGLGLDPSLLQAEGEFSHRVDTTGQLINIYLARFTCMDPPRALFADKGGRFCAITELRGGHPAEMGLLQRAYETILG